jgi:type VII secretion protein EccB
VLADGVQRIGEVAADLIRIGDSQGSREIPTVAPDVVRDVPVVESLPVSTFPRRAGMTAGATEGGVLCAQWRPDGTTSLWSGAALPTDSPPVELAQSDGQASNIDSVAMPAGRSAYVRSTALTGDGGDAAPLYLVTDTGVLFGIHDYDTAKVLGLEGDPIAAPWPVLSRLPRGPALSRDSALVARDSLPSPP